MVKLVQGHHLRSNQYLLVRVYNEDEARKNWKRRSSSRRTAEGDGPTQPVPRAPADLTIGKLLIIRGTEVSFYIPPTGVEVVPDEPTGNYVREALTLERLEYCILVDENGKKRFERRPAGGVPRADRDASSRWTATGRKFKAIELNEIQGLHIKVIAPYKDEQAARAYSRGRRALPDRQRDGDLLPARGALDRPLRRAREALRGGGSRPARRAT
jgi:major vault protein